MSCLRCSFACHRAAGLDPSGEGRSVNLRIRRLGVVLSVLYLVLFLQLNRIQFFGVERLQDDVNNTRA